MVFTHAGYSIAVPLLMLMIRIMYGIVKQPASFTRPALLPPHGNFHLGFAILDQLAGQIYRHALDGPGEGERTAILLRRCWIGAIIPAGQALRPEYEQDRVGHVYAAHQLAVDVEL